MPRSSAAGHSAPLGGTESRAGLPAPSPTVGARPPLSASGLSSGSACVPGPLASEDTFPPPSVIVPLLKQLVGSLPPSTEFWSARLPKTATPPPRPAPPGEPSTPKAKLPGEPPAPVPLLPPEPPTPAPPAPAPPTWFAVMVTCRKSVLLPPTDPPPQPLNPL